MQRSIICFTIGLAAGVVKATPTTSEHPTGGGGGAAPGKWVSMQNRLGAVKLLCKRFETIEGSQSFGKCDDGKAINRVFK